MDSGSLTVAGFLDLSKAFDTVDHNLLLHKLKSVGLSDDTVNWLQSYLTKRNQRASVGDSLSLASPIAVGVPQGSILGPPSLSYLCKRFTIVSACQWNYSLRWWHFDLLLIDWSVDLESELNSDLGAVSKRFWSNLLSLNIFKCSFVIFGNSRNLKLFTAVTTSTRLRIVFSLSWNLSFRRRQSTVSMVFSRALTENAPSSLNEGRRLTRITSNDDSVFNFIYFIKMKCCIVKTRRSLRAE